MNRRKELEEKLIIRYKEIMENPKISESIDIDNKQLNAIVTFHNGQNSFSAIFEYKINANQPYWYCVRDWND